MTQALKELTLALACFLYALARGAARQKVEHKKNPRIVIIQLAKLGDMVCTTPIFRAVKKRYPDAHLAVVGSAINGQVLEHSEDVDEYTVFEGILPLIRHLRTARYDFGATPTPSMAALVTMFLGGVRTIAVPRIENGVSPLETLSYRLARPLVATRPHRMGHYAPREYLRLLEPLGIESDDTTKRLAYSSRARKQAEEFLGTLKHPLVGIAPGSGNKIKSWPSRRFATVSDALVRGYGATVIVIGGERDAPEVEEMLKYCKEQAIDALNLFSIDKLKAVIARLDLFVSVDTGPIYIAEAFGVPTVDIVGPMDEREQPPRGEKHLVVVPERAAPELHIMNARRYDRTRARRQVESISPEAVLEACTALLSR